MNYGHHLRNSIIMLLMLSLWTAAAGQRNVTLTGVTEDGAGKRIELYGYENMLTLEEVLLDETVIDSNGAFEVGTYITYPRLVVVQIERYSQSFYIEPGRRYEIYLPAFNWDIDEQRNVYLDPVALPLEFLNLPADELNLSLGRVDAVADSFVSVNRMRFDRRFRPDRRYFDTLTMEVNRAVPDGNNEFLNRYKRFRLAQMGYAMGMRSRKQVMDSFVDGQELRYYDENYMQLIFAVLSDRLSKGMKRVPKWRIEEWVAAGNIESYLDSAGLDPLLGNEQVRELAVLTALNEAYYDPAYIREGVVLTTKKLAAQTKFPAHKKLAESLLRQWEKVVVEEQGEQNIVVELPDVEHNMTGFDSMRGKWLYVSFVRVGDPNCLSEIETMAHFRDTVYNTGKIEYVSVVCDREFQKMYHFLKNNRKAARYNWRWLHFDGNYRLLEHFGVVSYPTFVLIDPEGKVVNPYAPAPAMGYLLQMIDRLKKRN